MTFRATYINGKVQLEPGASFPEGTPLRVEPVAAVRSRKTRKRSARKLSTLARFAVKTGIRDLSTEHDHHTYGTPKRRKAKPRRS